MSTSEKPAYPPVASDSVAWDAFERGRFGSRFKHLTRAVMGERPYRVEG